MYVFKDTFDIILEPAISGNITSREIEQMNKYFRELKKEKNIKYGIVINFPQLRAKVKLKILNIKLI